MIPFFVRWSQYSATVPGQAVKHVLCENCANEYIYLLEREGQGFGNSVYWVNEQVTHHIGSRRPSGTHIRGEYLPRLPGCGSRRGTKTPNPYEVPVAPTFLPLPAIGAI
jgi:hypothetical protein